MILYWSLIDSKSPLVSRTLPSILAVLHNVVGWMVSTRSPTSNSSTPFSNPLVTVPNAPVTIGYYCSLTRAFHISDSRWFFTEVWVTASLLKSPGLFLVFWQFSTMLSFGWSPLCPPTSKSSSPFSNPLVTVPNAPITIGIIVPCMFHSFLISLARSRYLSFFSHSFSFIQSVIIIIIIIIITIIIYSFRVFHISVSWWFFTGVWVTASLLKSPGLVSGFWPFLAMLSFG